MHNYDKTIKELPFFGRISDLKDFTMSVDIPRVPNLREKNFASRVSEVVYDEALKTLQAASFYEEHSLEVKIDDDGDVLVTYTDDKYHFSVLCMPNQIQIRRQGSSLRAFYDWYFKFMPHAATIISAVISNLNQQTERTIEPLSVSYLFKLITFDLREKGGEEPVRNFQVIQDLMPKTPSKTGTIDSTENPEKLGRMDYKVHRWAEETSHPRNLIYNLEAPANKDFTTLWFTFGYKGGTFHDMVTGERITSSADTLLHEYEEAFGMFTENAVEGFLRSILNPYLFRTTAGIIP